MLMYLMQRLLLFLCASMLFVTLSADEAPYRPCLLTGRVCNADGEALAEAWVRVKGSHVGCRTDAAGRYRLSLRRGTHTLQVTAMGHRQHERQVTTTEGSQHLDFSLTPLQVQLTRRGEGGAIYNNRPTGGGVAMTAGQDGRMRGCAADETLRG